MGMIESLQKEKIELVVVPTYSVTLVTLWGT